MDRAVKQSDKMEAALMQRLEGIYSDALMDALKKHQGFLQLVKDVADGKKKPPARYADNPEKIAQWKAGFLREQMRQMGVIESISKDLAAVGPEAAEQIKDTMADVYAVNREFTTDMIQNAVHTSFSQYDKRQIRVLMQETESPFSRIAYRNLGKDTLIRKRLQNEMATATLLGESQRDIIKRIRKVTGQTAYQAKRVAQTERTRIQSQARYEACQEAADKGVHVVNTWTAKMDNTRDAHAERNGQKAEQGKPFPGSVMKYPGDPAGGAAEVINCHCVLVPDVVIPYGRKNYMKSAETVGKSEKSNTPNETGNKENADIHAVGRINRELFKAITTDATTDQVIITEERIAHSNLHSDAYAKYGSYVSSVLDDPDIIFRDKRPNTAVLIKRIEQDGKSLELVLRIHVSTDNPEYKNSIISFWDISETRRKNYERNKDIIYKKE